MNEQALSDMKCPYCGSDGSDGSCGHLLLVVDQTFRAVEGGTLEEIFAARLLEAIEGDEGISRELLFDTLVADVDVMADAKQCGSNDGPPGMSSAYLCLYAASTEKANAMLRRFTGATNRNS